MSIVLCEPFAYMDLLPHCMCASCTVCVHHVLYVCIMYCMCASCTVCMQVICSTHHIYMCMYFSLGHLHIAV